MKKQCISAAKCKKAQLSVLVFFAISGLNRVIEIQGSPILSAGPPANVAQIPFPLEQMGEEHIA
jgi:hypothetical protein